MAQFFINRPIFAWVIAIIIMLAGALAMLKRLWPRWFVKHELGKCDLDVRRFVVSTHTLAVSTSLERWLEQGAPIGAAGEHVGGEGMAQRVRGDLFRYTGLCRIALHDLPEVRATYRGTPDLCPGAASPGLRVRGAVQRARCRCSWCPWPRSTALP